MTIHPAFTPARPALAPILFPRRLDDLLTERRNARALAYHSLDETKHRFAIVARQLGWSHRLNARIAQVAK